MEKIVKVIALTTTQQLLITEIREVAAVDIGEPDCKLVSPFWINTLEGTTTLEPVSYTHLTLPTILLV